MTKTEVELYLESQNISYTPYVFSKREDNPTNTPIFKTLVLKGDKTGPTISVIPLDARLDYKKAAKISGNRKLGLPPIEYVLSTTGYPHGANTPIGISMHQPHFPIIFDVIIQSYEKIIISSGELDRGVIINVKELINLVNPTLAEIIQK